MKFKNIYKEAKEDVELSLLSLWAPGQHRMRGALRDLFRREPLMAEPVFQSMFPWELTKDPNWTSYLGSQVISKLHIGKAAGGDEPRQLQTESWKELKNGNSIVVTSGTGSGKTECFMYPVLSDLFSRKASNGVDPVGALFLYPLNALMQDQKERLGERCTALGLKFAVYNSTLEENRSKGASTYPMAEVMTRKRVRDFDRSNTSCPQILLTNPSMLEYMLVRDKDKTIFDRSQGALRWIVIDEAHTYTGSAAVELAYLIKRVLQAFGVTRDQVQFVCTSATIGDPAKPQELIDFITSIIGDYSPTVGLKLVPIDGKRIVSPLTAGTIQKALTAESISGTTGDKVKKLRDSLNKQPMQLSSIWHILTGKCLAQTDTKNALDLLDKLCEIKVGSDYLLMARGHFFMRTIEGLYACINTHCRGKSDFSKLGFNFLTTYRGDGKCPHCGAPLLEIVQCNDCKEFLLTCEENDKKEIRPTYNDDWSSVADVNEFSEDEQDNGSTDGGKKIDDNWERKYLAFYGNSRVHRKPHPERYDSRISIDWDGSVLKSDDNGTDRPWVMLQNDMGQLFCPTCSIGSGENGERFRRFHSPSDWLNRVLAPSLLKESASNGIEWGKYIAFTDSRQGTAIYAKRFNVDAERAYARARVADELSNPNNNINIRTLIQSLRAVGKSEAEITAILSCLPTPTGSLCYTMQEVADCIFNSDIFEHIDYEIEISHSKSTARHTKSEDAYKSALLRGIIGRKPVHVASLENLGLITICYPAIDNMQTKDLPNQCSRVGIRLQDWKNFLKICLDYYVRMGNHLQAATYNENTYIRDSDQSTPFKDWPSVKVSNNGISLIQNRIVMLLCAGLGIHDITALQARSSEIDRILNEAFIFLKDNVLTTVNIYDLYYNYLDENERPGKYDGWYYLDMSPTSNRCKVKLTDYAWRCPVTESLLDTIFMGYSPTIKGALCPENIARFAINPNSPQIKIPHLRENSFSSDVTAFNSAGVWTDRHKYAFGKTQTGYLTAEHSGQQDREILTHYTQEFKATPHKLNLLQCSTTMEMGVDIGNIDLVLMTNIPPSSANYMQRAGRAGRRGQSKACSFSICPSTAIGAQAFKNPSSNLTGINPAIRPVESEIIIQRHANSFFVRQFLLDPAASSVKFHKVESWLNKGGDGDRFCDWLNINATTPSLIAKFSAIFGSTRPMGSYISSAISSLQDIQKEYQQTHTDIVNAITDAQNAGESEKENAFTNQLIALEGQDLKGYLAENRFLPNADMPTGVVEFNHMDLKSANDLRNKQNERDIKSIALVSSKLSPGKKATLKGDIDKLEKEIDDIIRRSISTREIKIALSEYAPGQTVVINERNYISAGIEWKNSLGQANPYKYIYHCDTCGRFEYTDNSTLSSCPNCNGILRNILFPQSHQAYTIAIEPVRFRTDVNASVSRKERTEREFFNIQTILTNVDWDKAIAGPLCDIVGNNDANGEIVFFNPGKGKGFSLCLDCGRMTESYVPLSGRNWEHKRINELDPNGCPVNNVNYNVVLSGKFPTSFVAIKFYEDSSRIKLVDDEELLYSLGILLCRALVKTIGVSREDIDFDIRQEQGFFSIYIYDTSKGGCGYSTRMLDPYTCNKVFQEAKTMLSTFGCTCEKYVSGACVNCLIDRSSQRREKSLSKFKVMAWFAGQTMHLTPSTSGTAVTIPLQFLATRKIDKNTRSMTFCVDASDMHLSEWSQKSGAIGHIIDYAISKGIGVNIVVANVPSIANGDKLEDIIPFIDLPQKFSNWGVNITAVKTLETNHGEFSALIINDNEHFFTNQPDVLPFNEDWGIRCTYLFENQVVPNFVPDSFPTLNEISTLMRADEFTRDYTYDGYNNPLYMPIGGLFSNIIQKHLLKPGDEQVLQSILSGQNVEISFSDSYVNSALASLMLVYLLKNFKDHYGFNISRLNLQFRGPKRKCANNLLGPSTYISFNFADERDADDYTEGLCKDELGVTPIFSSISPDHCRWIRFLPENGDRYVEFRPDHGIDGGWESSSKYNDLAWLDDTTPVRSKGIKSVFYLLVKKK